MQNNWWVKYLANWSKIVVGVTLIWRKAVAVSKCNSYRPETALFKFGGLKIIRQTAKLNTPLIILRIRYSQCCSHVLSLAVVNTCESMQVGTYKISLLYVACKVHQFFDNHPKCQYALSGLCDGSSTKVNQCAKQDGCYELMLYMFLCICLKALQRLSTIIIKLVSWCCYISWCHVTKSYTWFWIYHNIMRGWTIFILYQKF